MHVNHGTLPRSPHQPWLSASSTQRSRDAAARRPDAVPDEVATLVEDLLSVSCREPDARACWRNFARGCARAGGRGTGDLDLRLED